MRVAYIFHLVSLSVTLSGGMIQN
ncbi:uncharacterized protein METZ01_LOCUS470559 [marine metagenome]|uniref:Uncharacterized protein n=1 Tax=marine metagenome TaxID=408172 RepID=A0A383BE51_9ZZZZ